MRRRIAASDRYHFQNTWLSAYWHFSFQKYSDPANVRLGPLRVFNEDWIAPGHGFAMHPHREMELLTLVLSGVLGHRDNVGQHGRLHAGEVQHITAGTGIRHEVYNPGPGPAHVLQLQLIPREEGLRPSTEQKAFAEAEMRGRLKALVTAAGEGGALRMHQDATLYRSLLEPAQSVTASAGKDRAQYVFIVRGDVRCGHEELTTGDQLMLLPAESLEVLALAESDLILLDLPMD